MAVSDLKKACSKTESLYDTENRENADIMPQVMVHLEQSREAALYISIHFMQSSLLQFIINQCLVQSINQSINQSNKNF